MTDMRSKLLLLATLTAAGASLAACSSGQGLTTASILGGPSTAEAAPAAAVKPQDRAIQVAAVSARAQKCGYNFDPMKLRANYLSSETAGGLDATQTAQLGEIYDKTNRAVVVAIQSEQGFCTEEKTKQIKADLTRHLAGDFSTNKGTVAQKSGGFFDSLIPEQASGREVINPEWMRDSRAPKTIRTE
jgi:hypothetical protein